MRTPQQIENLRLVFSLQIGPVAYMYPAEHINALADKIQKQLDSKPEHWHIKVRFKKDGQKSWSEIPDEPTCPFASLTNMRKKAKELLDRNDTLDSISIRIADSPLDIYFITRDKQDGGS